MNLFHILKQLKHIEPDPAFSATSKRAILAMAPKAEPWTVRRTILTVLETGVAVALTGFFIILITGGLSGSKLAPVQYSAIDPQSLRAEAQAVDIQIELANLSYTEPSAESTAPVAGIKVSPPKKHVASPSAEATSSTTSTISLDQALERLAN